MKDVIYVGIALLAAVPWNAPGLPAGAPQVKAGAELQELRIEAVVHDPARSQVQAFEEEMQGAGYLATQA